MIRSGRYGERDQWALSNGYSGGGWKELPDLTPYTTREQIAKVTAAAFPGAPAGRLHTQAAQLWALRGRIEPGDLLVMPLKTTKRIAMGWVTGGYRYLGDDQPPDCRHVITVDWQITDLPRTAVKQDLLYTLGSAVSIFAPSKNNAIARLEHLLKHGTDPGAVTQLAPPGQAPQATPTTPDDSGVEDPELATDYEQAAIDQITSRIQEDFAGHELTSLVAAVLEAEGFRCLVSPPGPDSGVDISAGKGPLGLDTPRLIVQVKGGSQIGSPVVSQLQGVMSTYGADQGLLVAWGGLTKQARDLLRHQHLRVRVWEAADVVEAVLRTYDRLPDGIKTQLPLKRIWVLSNAQ
ncbi:restriction endonuclease [Pseudonocardia bannensis]|uniref:Restriction endonuclease n=1 Tax=Pseudonocardia bannensis TaxID=630973 RepID=A0A848DLT8_9PSEU|nr:restriction endonuclease [Pseudonocardia bannensis]